MTREDLLALRSNPNVAAFLRLIRQGESSQDFDAYTVMYGGGHFDDFSRHPNIVNKSRGISSTAAGAYQFLKRTWDEIAAQYQLPDFTPENQDCGAIGLIIRRKALDAVLDGRVHEAIDLCRNEWASLPGSQYGQPTQKLQNAIAVYLQYGGTLAENDPARAAPPRKEAMIPVPLILAGLDFLAKTFPVVAGLVKSDASVPERNIAIGTTLINAAKDAANTPSFEEAIQKMQDDPAVKDAVGRAMDEGVQALMEVGGGIDKARKDHAMPDQIAFYKNPAFLIALVLIPLIYMVAVAVLFGYGGQSWSDEIKAMVVTGIIAGLMGSITGFFLGSSLGSQKKDAALAR